MAKRLANEYKDHIKDPNYLYSINMTTNIFKWEFVIIGPSDTLYEGGIFKGIINFPKDYPIKPPKVLFTDNMIHPNIYPSGDVCISILHAGSDQYGYEHDSERWLPSHNVNTIMLSIISLLSSPNFDSPANIDASTLWKKDLDTYRKKIYKLVAKTQS